MSSLPSWVLGRRVPMSLVEAATLFGRPIASRSLPGLWGLTRKHWLQRWKTTIIERRGTALMAPLEPIRAHDASRKAILCGSGRGLRLLLPVAACEEVVRRGRPGHDVSPSGACFCVRGIDNGSMRFNDCPYGLHGGSGTEVLLARQDMLLRTQQRSGLPSVV